MSAWGFSPESGQNAAGANTIAARAKGFQPYYAFDGGGGMASKRNVIATNKGWVRREHVGSRVKEEIIVAANPGDTGGKDYTSNTFLNSPDVCQIFVKLNANGYIGANVASANLHVVFNTPIHHKASGNLVTVVVSNTIGGNIGNTLFANTAAQGRIINANNTLVFRMPPLQGGSGSAAATYKVAAQTIRVNGGGNPLYNPDDGTAMPAANLVITGAVANNLLDGAGVRISTFQVARPAGQT
tara:strand:+ start:238 stop:963 length:726 start_codon:yes stop_codon:yes gene_type:complete